MVAIVRRYANAIASGLVPLLSRLSAGTEMASYKNDQWEFLLGSKEITTFVAVEENNNNNCNDDVTNILDATQPLLGCLLRVDMPVAESNTYAGAGAASAAGFGMMLVSPEARGKGVAKQLLNAAMSQAEDDRQHPNYSNRQLANNNENNNENNKITKNTKNTRKLLAVCTKLGQPAYRKLGFSDVGRVISLTTTVGAAKEMVLPSSLSSSSSEPRDLRIEIHGSMDRSAKDCNADACTIPPEVMEDLVRIDAQATGYDRRERLRSLVKGPSSSSSSSSQAALKSMVALARSSSDRGSVLGTAVLRQEGPGSPLVVGPVSGSGALPMISALAKTLGDEHDDSQTMSLLLVKDESASDLEAAFIDAGFAVGFELPAMALDGRPVYEGGMDYRALIHPTLG